jgi:hypothetical protein
MKESVNEKYQDQMLKEKHQNLNIDQAIVMNHHQIDPEEDIQNLMINMLEIVKIAIEVVMILVAEDQNHKEDDMIFPMMILEEFEILDLEDKNIHEENDMIHRLLMKHVLVQKLIAVEIDHQNLLIDVKDMIVHQKKKIEKSVEEFQHHLQLHHLKNLLHGHLRQTKKLKWNEKDKK